MTPIRGLNRGRIARRYRAPKPITVAIMAWVAMSAFGRAGFGASGEDSLSGIDADLDQAKAVYGRASFHEAVALLQDAVRRLEVLRATQPRVDALAEAYLHLALAQLGIGDRGEAKESFRRLVRLAPGRTLDPNVYAPKVLALLEEARGEVAREVPAPSATSAPRGGGTGKALLLGGAVSAGLGGALLASSGGGVSPPPVPTLAPADIELASSVPAPGTTVRLSLDPPLKLSLWVVHPESGDYQLTVNEINRDGTSKNCLATIEYRRLTGGEPILWHAVIHRNPGAACGSSSFEVSAIEAWLRRMPGFRPAAYSVLPAPYSVRP